MSDIELPDRDELLRRLNAASLQGSVQATRLLLEELRRDVSPESEDELERLLRTK